MWDVWCAGGPVLISGRCPVTRRGWVGGEPQQHHRVLLVRAGAFLRRLNGVEAFVDCTSVSVVRPGDDMQVAHPLGCGDLFTILELRESDADECGLRGGEYGLGDELDLAHRHLINAARQGIDELELAERMGRILDRLPSERQRDRGALRASHRRLVAQAAELMVTEGYGLGLEGIAGRLQCSPHHLSRVFHRVMGQTMSAYRNRARVRQVLADLEDGDLRLRDLAARYGFADQAHMIRVVRRHAGDSPGTLQKMLRA
ncbi:MAG TPA: helix-turn-helix transcriptional regulator [Candidatus Limnocylindrales bacterium]|nr:helix-turn-helix transcriptional regulator [Candidatus Limnocylindrales bacterium]